jgi:hypothetical protein
MAKLSFKISDYQSTLSGLVAIEIVSSDALDIIIASDLVSDQQELTILTNYRKKVVRNRAKIPYKQADYNFGRNFAVKGLSLGWQRAPTRHTLMKLAGYQDIDMVNCHATILQQLCKSNGIACPQLDDYIDKRDIILAEVIEKYTVSRDQAKKLFIILLFYGSFDTWKKDEDLDESIEPTDYITAFSNEIQQIGNNIILANPKEVELCKKLKKKHPKGSVVSLLLQSIEDHILGIIYNKLGRPKVVVLSFDGLAVLISDFPEINLEEIEQDITDKTNFKMKLLIKPFSHAVDLKDLKPEEETYPFTEFEKTNFKIKKSGMYCEITSDNTFNIRNKSQLVDAYEHLPNDFIKRWTKNNPLIRIYDDIDFFPPPLVCPPNKFNLWKPPAMELVDEWEHKEEELQLLLKHILIMCDNDQSVADWLINWIGQMIQYPATKSRTPVLISKQGAGKGTLLRVICKMIGKDKYWETAKPERDVWGNFNKMLVNSYFVNLNEIGQKQVMESENELKKLQTDSEITINGKGIDPFEINSYHRFFITTNHLYFNTSEDDRRNVFIRTSDELIGNKAYFTRWNDEIFDDVNCIKTFYEYFKSLPDLDKFNSMPVPDTEHQQDLKQLSISKPEMWLKHYIQQTITTPRSEPRRMTSIEIFGEFNRWKENQGIQYETNPLKIVIAIKNLRIDGISTKKEKQGNITLLDYNKLVAYFNLED